MFINNKFYLVIVLIFTYNILISKELPKSIDIPVQLSKADQKRIDHANELVKSGRDLWNQINSQYNPDGATNPTIDSIYNKEAMPLLLKAAGLFDEGNSLMYEVYHKNNNDFWNKHKYDFPTGLDNAKQFQKDAINYVQKAQLNRRVAENYQHEYVKAYNSYFEAISLEIIAAKKEGRALQIYADWPIHYSYPADEDIENDLFNPKPVVAAIPPKPVEKKEEPKIVADTTAPAPEPVISQPVKAEPEVLQPNVIYFSVQIAAHTVHIPENNIRETIYNGIMKINEIHEDGWYKYLLGHYTSYYDAVKLLNEIKVDKAFVVAYKNGKRVPLNEVNK